MSSSLAFHKRSSRSCPEALTIPLRLPTYLCCTRNRYGQNRYQQITTWSNAHWGSLWRFWVCWHLAPAALPSTGLQTGQRSQCIQGLKFLMSRSESSEKCCLPLWIDCDGTVDAEFLQVVFHVLIPRFPQMSFQLPFWPILMIFLVFLRVRDEFLTSREYDPYLAASTCFGPRTLHNYDFGTWAQVEPA